MLNYTINIKINLRPTTRRSRDRRSSNKIKNGLKKKTVPKTQKGATFYAPEQKTEERRHIMAIEREAATVMVNPLLESTVKAYNALSPKSQELISLMVRQLAEREGINMALTSAPRLQTPAEGIPLWLAKLKAERPRLFHFRPKAPAIVHLS